MVFSNKVSEIFIAVSLLAWGVIHFLTGEFIAGRANTAGVILAYASGVVLIAAAVAIIFKNDKTKFVIACAGFMILGWAASRNLYLVVSNLDYGGVLTNFGKAITIGSGLLLIAFDNKRSLTAACICTGIFFVIGGVQHFLFIDFVKMLVPRWIPGDVFWSYVAGVGLIASGIALITGFLRKQASLVASWMVFIWFLVLHIPRGFGETASYNEWVAIFEALFVAALLHGVSWRCTEIHDQV